MNNSYKLVIKGILQWVKGDGHWYGLSLDGPQNSPVILDKTFRRRLDWGFAAASCGHDPVEGGLGGRGLELGA